MQVDPSPMNVGDGGTVSRESSAPTQVSESMVGNPQQTLPLELRGDVPQSQQNKLRVTTDCKTPDVCSEASNLNHCPQVPPSQPHSNVFSTDPVNTPLPDRIEVSKGKIDGAGIFSTHQWPCGKKVTTEDPVNSVHSNINLNKKTNAPAPTQPVISVPLGFQCSTLFKPGQPVAFLPPSNFSSPLCKITLPPGLGQIAALREATASQFQKDCPAQSSCSSTTPMLKTYPYHFSVGRGPGAEKKHPSSGSKVRCDSLSKGFQARVEHKGPMSSVAAPALALPVQQATQGSAPPTRYTISPTAAICCSPALANITTQSRLLSLVEKGSTFRGAEKTSLAYLKPKTLSTPEELNVSCPVEPRDVPLDLSAKSKRQKSIKDTQNNPSVATEHHSVEAHQKNITGSKKIHSASFHGSSSTFDTQRNGATQKSSSKLTNHHALEPNTSWVKSSSSGSLNNLPGTYVGVASPILASTLRSKDGKGAAFVEDLQTFAKQETISIIDQGEQPVCRERKAQFAVKGSQHNKSGKLSTGTQQGFLSTQLCATVNSQPHRKSVGGKGGTLFTPPVKSLWQPPCVHSQGASLQKKPSQTQAPKTKSTLSCERALFHNSHLSPTKVEDEKWEKAKSPLSNLESIVKQKTLETTALTGENYCNLSSVGSKRPEVVSIQNRCQDSTLQQTLTAGSPPFRTIEGQVIKSDRTSPQTDSTAALNRPEITTVPVPKDKGREKQTKQTENQSSDSRQKIKSSTPSKRSSPSIKVEWKERKLVQHLEDETAKEKASERKISSHVKVEGIALSLLQSNTVEVEGEAKINGAKEEIPSKGKVSIIKQKNLKKHAKEKTPPEVQKKTAPRKQKDKDSPSVKQGLSHKKKKDVLPGVGKSVLKDGTGPGPKAGGKTRKGKSCPANVEHTDSNKIDSESSPCRSPQVDRDSGSLSSPGWPSKESDSQEEASPRLRRGRRRTDEALLRDWSFATPPTPPPLDPPSTPPPVPVRRPRGRPRINPLPEEVDADKDRPTEGGDTSSIKKRKRCKNRKYQNGEYITEKDKVADGEEEKLGVEDGEATNEKTGVYPCLSATLTGEVPSPDVSPRRTLFTRSGSTRPQDSPPATHPNTDKPAGKRKFKSKHLCDTDEQKKLKTKKGSLGKRTGPLVLDEDGPPAKKTPTPLCASPKPPHSPLSGKKGTAGKLGIPESTPSRPVPPEVRRLIVNKNAGETLLQRAARLGYQDVVLYCLEKDVREVNRRDNAGYTALHEACARGWTHIVQVLLKHGADVNCSAQDGTRPIHDAVAADNLPAVWMLLNHGADPTLATYSGQTAVKLAQSPSMKTFLKEYFTDLEGRTDQDPSLQWDFYSSSVFEKDQEPCWDFLLSQPEDEGEEMFSEQVKERDADADCLLFEFSSEPLLSCYHVQVSLTQGFCNWFLLADVLKRLKMSARIFRARYPQFEVVNIAQAELWKQVSVSQTCSPPDELQPEDDEDGEETVELVRCVPELQGLLGSSIQILRDDDNDNDEDDDDKSALRPCSR
nr:BCL-6 corepressor-like protein 1 isoform X2 [Danio rerio]|eukprot:XP_005173374.1 BCL-6 corepressor-like protein 1 isoform X2 [Danio rerio]